MSNEWLSSRAQRGTGLRLRRFLAALGMTVLAFGATPLLGSRVQAQSNFLTVDKYAQIDRVASPQISPDGKRIVFLRSHVDTMQDKWVGMLWLINADGTQPTELVKGSAAQWSPDGTRIAYLADAEGKAQLFVRVMAVGGTDHQVTTGAESPVTFRWSPDSRSIAFTMAVPDSSGWKVDLPVPPPGAQWAPPPRTVDRAQYRADRAGLLADEWLHLFVVPADGGDVRQVTHGAFNVGARGSGIPSPPQFDWSFDGKTIFADGNDAADADRQYQVSNIYSIDVASGTLRRLTADAGFWHAPVTSPDGKWIAFIGFARTGNSYRSSDLYIMHPDGSTLRLMTPGLDRDPQSVTWGDNETIYFTAEDHGSVNAWAASFNAKASAPRQVSNGLHVLALGSISIRGGVAVATRTSPQQPAEVVRFALKKSWDLRPVTHVTDGIMSHLQLGELEQVDFRSGIDNRVQGWLLRPPAFDPSKKYPLLLEIHGGPHSMSNVGFNPSFQNFAASGFMVLYLNPRGSTGYGSTFGNAIAKAFPGVDYDDLMAGIDEVIGRGGIDTTRMFVGGCSGGGLLTTWVIGHTARFAAAAVRCPVTDWISFAGQTDIPMFAYDFFDRPFWEDSAPWLRASPITYAGNIHTPTLIMTGTQDMRTPIPQSEELYAALQVRGVPTVLLRFSEEYHGTTSKPSNWVRTQLYMTGWYNRYGPAK